MESNQMIKQTKYGWVDLSNLARKNNKIDWYSSFGTVVKFQYKDIVSHIIVKEYLGYHNLIIDIPNYVENCKVQTDSVINGRFGVVLSLINFDFLYKVGDIVNDNMLILSCFKKGYHRYYEYKCLIDGYIGYVCESGIKRGRNCPVCFGNKVVCGINDLLTLRPDIVELMVDKEKALTCGVGSHKKTDFICKRCGSIINARIDHVCNGIISCKQCSDGLSYPSKFVYNFLRQILPIELFDMEKTFDWSKKIQHKNLKLSGNKKYDFYISSTNPIIIEAHGEQHFKKNSFHSHKNSKTLEEEQENDKLKMQLAINNGILPDHYIQLDCRESNMEYIKSSIMQSELPRLFHFTEDQIDWQECNRFATSSRVYEACELWNNGLHSTTKIGIKMKLNQTTILKYLRRGSELGIVNDPPKHKKKL